MKQTGIVIQTRITSTRLPKKPLLPIVSKTLTEHIIDRFLPFSDKFLIILATPDTDPHSPLRELAHRKDIEWFGGSEQDVLDRFYQASKKYDLENIVRVTGDNPLIYSEGFPALLKVHTENQNDLTYYTGLPIGCGYEIMTFEALSADYKNGKSPHHREHVTTWMKENQKVCRVEALLPPVPLQGINDYRLTVDTPEDLEVIRKIYDALYKGVPIPLKDALDFLKKRPDIRQLNAKIEQKSPQSYEKPL